jgi:hypothetical protein
MSEENRVKTGNNPPEEHQFKPGVSGNPNGRPKGVRNKKTIIAEFLESQGGMLDGRPATNIEIILATWIKKAKENGDDKAIRDLLDRYLGKADQNVNMNQGGELTIRTIYDDARLSNTEVSESSDREPNEVHDNPSGETDG